MNKKTKKTALVSGKMPLIAIMILAIMIVSVVSVTSVSKAIAVNSRTTEILSLLNALKGASDTDKEIIVNVIKEKASDEVGQEAMLGASADFCNGSEPTTNVCVYDIYDLTVADDLVVSGDVGFTAGKGYGLGTVSAAGVLTNGYRTDVLNVDLNATTSAGTVNPESETIWIYDATVRIQTATTTTDIEYNLGTTTDGIIAADGSCGTTGACGTAIAGEASILRTGAITPTTTDGYNMYFKDDFQGTDTRDASGTRYVVPVNSSEYLTCYASSSSAYSGGDGQAAQCQFKYYVIED